MAKSYKDKLLDPRWQKKRLKILDRDSFTCQLCKDTETTLHVHHLSYDKSYNPWDVSDTELITYCEDCHELVEKIKKSVTNIGIIIGIIKRNITPEILVFTILFYNTERDKELSFFKRYDNQIYHLVNMSLGYIATLNTFIKNG